MGRRLVVALLTGGFLGSGLAAALTSQAKPSTICIGRQDTMQLSPGLSLAPTTGPVNTVVDGTQECNGPIEGHQPTGPIRTRHSFTYGYADPDTCGKITAKGWNDYFIPTADGIVVLRNHFTGGLDPTSDPPANSGSFEGERTSGRFSLKPVEGDCVTSPLTRIEVSWISTWHGKGS